MHDLEASRANSNPQRNRPRHTQVRINVPHEFKAEFDLWVPRNAQRGLFLRLLRGMMSMMKDYGPLVIQAYQDDSIDTLSMILRGTEAPDILTRLKSSR